VILADRLSGYWGRQRPLPTVGATPIPLRIILGLRKARFQRIFVVTDRMTGQSAERALLRTRRLPDSVEWFEIGNGRPTLVDLVVRLAAAGVDKISFISGNGTYHPMLFQILGKWNGEDAGLLLRTGQNPVGACVLNSASSHTFAASVHSDASTTSQLEAWLLRGHGLTEVEVTDDRWQVVRTSSAF